MSSFQNPGRRGQYWVSAVDYGPNLEPGFGGYGSDRSNKTDDIIYIGDLFNSSVVAYKGFLEDIQYDVSKDGETEDKQETGVAIYNSYSGKMGIKLSFNVPSHTRNEAKNSLAKIEHLQKSIFQARNDSEGTTYYKKFKRSIQFVYLSNLINNGNLKASRAISNFTQLRSIGLPCNITEVSYKPDFTAGFHELGGRIYPKNYKLNLTLDPVTNVQVNGKFFIFPFNDNGHYNFLDSVGFPFLLKPGEPNSEAKDIRGQHGNDGWVSPDTFSDIGINTSKSNTCIYIAMPAVTKITSETNGKNNDVSISKSGTIKRYVAFKPFLTSFSRDFKKEVIFQQDAGSQFNQTIQNIPNNKAVDYSFSFEVPSRSLAEAKNNCAKVQYLLRMFYTRRRFSKDISSTDASSVKVYIHSFIESSNTKPKVATGQLSAHSRAARLQFKDLNIDIDTAAGFHREIILKTKLDANGKPVIDPATKQPVQIYSHSNLYPKSFKISIDLQDTNKFNYVKQKANSNLETTIQSEEFNARLDPKLFPSKTKYWSV